MIPTVIRRDTPLPIPRSVIRSPSHMAKMVPVERMMIPEIQKIDSDTAGLTPPCERM